MIPFSRQSTRPVSRFVWAALIPLTFAGGSGRAGDGATAGVCRAVRGVLLTRGDDQSWRNVKAGETIPGGVLLVSLFDSELLSANKAIKLELFGDIGTHGGLPLMEAAARIKANPKIDLDLTLERGTVVLTNLRRTGAATIRLQVRDEPFEIALSGAGASMALQTFGRHAPGAASSAADDPAAFAYFVVTKGKATVLTKSKRLALSAPPGPAVLRWDNLDRQPDVVNVPKAAPAPSAEDKAYFQRMCAAAESLGGADPVAAAVELLQSDREEARLVGVTALGALDALPPLLIALNDPKHADVRRHGILVLRNWLGREPGQIKKFQSVLLKEKKLTATQVKSAMSLLLGFDDAERAQPATYEFLIDALKHKSLAVRELAYWHLVRLAPAGKNIPFDATAPEEQRLQAVQRWQALIPPGQIPGTTTGKQTRPSRE